LMRKEPKESTAADYLKAPLVWNPPKCNSP